MEKERVVKIVKPDRVNRILTRVCNANLEVLIRSRQRKAVAVRGRASLFEPQSKTPRIKISNLSNEGTQYLASQKQLQVEFIGMSTQIIFNTVVQKIDGNSIFIHRPQSLISYDRRANARFPVTDQLCSFVQLSLWKPRIHHDGAPPMFNPYHDLASWIRLADISAGGFCAVTRFPAVLDALDRGATDYTAQFHLPMRDAWKVPVEVRWVRRLKERTDVRGKSLSLRSYRFGIQFLEEPEDFVLAVKQYIHQLSLSDAI